MDPIEPDQKAVALAAELKRQGADPGAAPEAAVARLREIRETGKASDLVVATVLGDIPSDSAAKLLNEIAGAAHGATRRAAKRALFKLRQHGVRHETSPFGAGTPSPDRPGPAQPVATIEGQLARAVRSDEYSGLSAMLSPFDANGERIVWLLKEQPEGGVRRLWGIVSERRGLRAMMSSRLSRRQLREERAEVERESGMRLVDAAAKLADFILCEAYRRTAETERAAVGKFLQVRAEFVAGAVPPHIEHPVYQELAGALDVTPAPALLDEPVMAAFIPPKDELESFAEEIERVRQSPLVLSGVQQQDRIAQILERALEHLLRDERRAAARRYLEDSAYYLIRANRSEAAQWAVAAAEMLAQGADVRRVPLFQRWVQAGVSAVAADAARRGQEVPRLILTPAEARRAAGSKDVRR